MNENLDPSGTKFTPAEKEIEKVLRPSEFIDFAGQENIIENLKVFVQAARQRMEPLDHVLLHGPPGLGKTTLSYIIANELNVNIKISSGPVLDKPGDLAGLLTSLEENDVLFIDEIHRLSPVVEEYLYSAMEDFKIDIMIETGPNARSIQIKLNPFTLIGATTRSGLLTAPLRSRFGINSRLNYYTAEVLERIIFRSADILKISIEKNAATEISRRSRGTPRIANLLLRRVRDFAQIKGTGKIDLAISQYALNALNVDKHGLDEMDNKILLTIIDKFKGGPVGLNTIATAVSEDPGTIEEVYEPFLIQEGYIMRTPRGREATEGAYKHLGKIKSGEPDKLFYINTLTPLPIMNYYNIDQEIKTAALKLGFSFCGIALAEPLENKRGYYSAFIKEKRHGNFQYLETNLEKRIDPGLILEDAKSVISVLMNYYPPEFLPEEDNNVIAKYAYGKDYHAVLKKKMNDLIDFLNAEYPGFKAKAFVDSGHVMEKTWAQQAGVGWQGKNTLLINKNSGSFFFIGIIFTNLELDPDQPERDHCGECRRCVEACPTGALFKPYQLDISLCISYHTIENKNDIPAELKDKFKNRIFGCDICQDVCPYNKFASPHNESDFLPSAGLKMMRKDDWINLKEEQFDELFRGSCIERTGYKKLMSTIRTFS